jgi:transglutaminase-like putative cysteine protease
VEDEEDTGGWNVEALRTAGTTYPTEVRERYLGVPPNVIGPNARAIEDRVVAAAGPGATPIDLAEAMIAEFRSNRYTYKTDITDLPCATLSTVECVATYRQGFCQHYAMTMAVLLRDLSVPTRIVEGFLPGERSGDVEVIRNVNAHAWLEVYFPGFGWRAFDPTTVSHPIGLPTTRPTTAP